MKVPRNGLASTPVEREGFEPDLTEAAMLGQLADPLANPHEVLQGATTRLILDLFAYQRTQGGLHPQPSLVYTLARETHVADLPPSAQSGIQNSFSYSDGFSREIQKKTRRSNGFAGANSPLRTAGAGAGSAVRTAGSQTTS